MKTFSCRFGRGVSCTVEVRDELPTTGQSHVLRIEWQGNPGPRTLRPYVAWMNSVNQQLADQWQVRLLHLFIVAPGKVESWTYQPGGKPQLTPLP